MASDNEDAWVLSSLLSPSEAPKVLDVGCVWKSGRNYTYLSILGAKMVEMEYVVWGIDLRAAERDGDGVITTAVFPYVIGDIRKAPFPDGFFDQIIATSTIEHIGLLDSYGTPIEDPDGDGKAVEEMIRVLKAGGLMLITVPYTKQFTIHRLTDGKPSTNAGRSYDYESLERVFFSKLNGFKVSMKKIPPRAAGIMARKYNGGN